MMSNKHKVLVFPCGSEIGLEIHSALQYSTYVELYGASSVASNHGKYVFKNYLEGLPFIDSPQFIPALNAVIQQYHIDFVFPAHDSVVLKLAEHQSEILCKVIGSPKETCRIARSKQLTYQRLQQVIPVPKIYDIAQDVLEFPLFLKPDVGQGSKGTHLAHCVEEVQFYLKQDPSLLLSEYLPGKEYTVDCFTDRAGNLKFVGARERHRILNGISADTYVVENTAFLPLAAAIHRQLVFRGAWFFQVKERANGQLVLMEFAPRIAGSMGFQRNRNVNLPLLSLFDAADSPVEIRPENYSLRMDRALVNRFASNITYRAVYIDLDDTLILNDQLNIQVMAFLYQCVNQGKKLHLLSRHIGNVPATLAKFRLQSLFDTVTVLDKNQNKADYVQEPAAIFIDDSFQERQCVASKGIATFDLSAIECLIDWRM